MLPLLGIGTYRLRDEQVKRVVKEAVDIGYELVDTAFVYKNETDIRVPKSVRLTSKLSPKYQGERCAEGITLSLENLGVDSLDCFLIHWPAKQGIKPDDPRNAQHRRISWETMEEFHKDGKLKTIGVSNYTQEHLRQLLEHADVKPSVLQTEFHPYWHDVELLEFCKRENIFLQAYSSFGEGELLRNTPAEITVLAKELNVTPAQVLLKWAMQQGVGVIPKASTRARLQENFDTLKLDASVDLAEELSSISGLKQKYCWDPSKVK